MPDANADRLALLKHNYDQALQAYRDAEARFDRKHPAPHPDQNSTLLRKTLRRHHDLKIKTLRKETAALDRAKKALAQITESQSQASFL